MVDKKNLTKFTTTSEVAFVAYPAPDDKAMVSTFYTLATRNRDRFRFATAAPALAKSASSSAGCITAITGAEEPYQKLCNEWRLDALENFVEKAAAPIVGEMTRRNDLKYFKVSSYAHNRFVLDNNVTSSLGNRLYTFLPQVQKNDTNTALASVPWPRYITNISAS